VVSWSTLSRAIEWGVVTDVQSLYESDFQRNIAELRNCTITV